MRGSKLKVLIAHHLITNEKTIFETHNTKDLPCNFDLVLSGDLHCGFKTHATESDGKYTVWANPGSVARLSISDYDRHPSMFIIDTSKYSVDDLRFIDRIEIPCGKSCDVFSERMEGISQDRYDNERFIDSIKTFETEAIDIYDLLEKVGKTDNISQDILGYILSKKK